MPKVESASLVDVVSLKLSLAEVKKVDPENRRMLLLNLLKQHDPGTYRYFKSETPACSHYSDCRSSYIGI